MRKDKKYDDSGMMKKTKSFKEAFKDYDEKVINFVKIFPEVLIGSKIVELRYGRDADDDAELYYIVLDNGIKIGLARVYPNGDVKELDRTEKYDDESIIRFQFHDWPGEKKKK